jgi:hypothetical protein
MNLGAGLLLETLKTTRPGDRLEPLDEHEQLNYFLAGNKPTRDHQVARARSLRSGDLRVLLPAAAAQQKS